MSPRGSAFLALSEPACRSGCGRSTPAGTPAPTCTRRTTGRRCGWPPTPAGSTSHRPGSAGSGTAPALELVEQIGVEQIRAHDVALANRFRAGLGLPPAGDSAIVSTTVPDAAAQARAGRHPGGDAGRALRASFHLYSTEADVDAALDALVG